MLFNALSWETHFASAHSADILEAVGNRPVSGDELAECLLHPDAGEVERGELFKLLDGLEDLGLIRRV